MKNKIKLFLKIFFILAAFFIIFHKIDINQLKSIKLQNPFFLFLAFLLFNASQIISALRVHHYLRMIEVTPKFKKQLMLYYVGMFYNMLLPGGIGGDAYKAYKFEQKYQKGYKKIIKALLIDRVSGLFAILILLSILLTFSNFNFYLKFTFLAIPVFIIMLFLIHHHFFKEFKSLTLKNLFLSIIISINFASRLTRPIVNLISASEKISSGDLSTKVSEIEVDEEKEKRYSRVVFTDGSFKDSVVKTNAIAILKQADIDEIVSV